MLNQHFDVDDDDDGDDDDDDNDDTSAAFYMSTKSHASIWGKSVH